MVKKLKNITYRGSYTPTERIPLQVMTLKSLIKYMRLSRGYTQKQLAEAIGTVRQHVQKWEYGKIKPNPKNMQEILAICRYESYNEVVRKFYA